MARQPGLTIVTILALALGIGGTTAMFSVVYGVLMAPMPYPHANQLVMVWSKVGKLAGQNVVSPGDYLDWKRDNHVFQSMVAWNETNLTLNPGNSPAEIPAQATTPGFYAQLGDPFIYGHDFTPNEGKPGQNHEIILTHKLWQARFHSNPHILGKQIQVDGETYTVTGVLAAGINDRANAEASIPLSFHPQQISHAAHYLLVMARLKKGVTIRQAQADMNHVAREIARRHLLTNKNWGVSVQPLHDDFLPKSTHAMLLILLAAGGVVLLIVCADVANLLLARGATRIREVAVRAALGASQGNILRLFLTESLMLALTGGGLGIFLAWGLLRTLMAILPANTMPIEAPIHISGIILLFALGISMLTGVLTGILPAWRASRVDCNENLKEGGRTGTGGARHRLQATLVMVEFGLAVMLLGLAGMTVHSFLNLSHAHLGFQPRHVLTGYLPAPNDYFGHKAQIAPFYQEILERVKAIPGVQHAVVGTAMPVHGTIFGMGFWFAGQPRPPIAGLKFMSMGSVTPGYFRTFGIRILHGRGFNNSDGPASQPVAMVNEDLVKKYFHGRNPLAQQLMVQIIEPMTRNHSSMLGQPVAWQVVGVYDNVRNTGSVRQVGPEMLVPFAQMPWGSPILAIQTRQKATLLSQPVSKAVASVDANLPFSHPDSMREIIATSLMGDRSMAAIFGAFAMLALLLAGAGVYGVMSFAITQRTHEIGLRMALGAAPGRVQRSTLRDGMSLALIGAAFGVAGAALTGRLIASLTYKLGKIDWPSLLAALIILTITALAGCWIPARRATQVDPMVALRQ